MLSLVIDGECKSARCPAARYPAAFLRLRRPVDGDYLIGFLLLQLANATFVAGQVLCRQLLAKYPTDVPLHRFFGHFLFGALVLALPSFLLFGNLAKLPQTGIQWGVLAWMGLFATALGMYWWVKGSTQVDAGTLAIMNELHAPAGLIVNLLIWNRDANLRTLAAGGTVILFSLWVNGLGRRMGKLRGGQTTQSNNHPALLFSSLHGSRNVNSRRQ